MPSSLESALPTAVETTVAIRSPALAPVAPLAIQPAPVVSSAGLFGSVEGTVSIKGALPTLPPLNTSADPVCRQLGVIDNRLQLRGRHLAGVIAYLDAPRGSATAPVHPGGTVVITQDHCAYEPRATALLAAQRLEVVNLDPTLHNLHLYKNATTVLNRGQPPRSSEVHTVLTAPGPYRLRCDVHPWMRADVLVLPHALFAVTDLDGHFRIDGVPAGVSDLTLLHGELGTLKLRVAVQPGRVSQISPAYGQEKGVAGRSATF